jgi:hypothetical protein
VSLEFEAEVFAWEGEGGWHFARLPREAADDVRDLPNVEPRGFGSVRVSASIGATTWQTSLFPEKASGSFLLPVKKSVRDAEGIRTDDVVLVRLAPEGEA